MNVVEVVLNVVLYGGAVCVGWMAKGGADYVSRKGQNRAQVEDTPRLTDAEEITRRPYREAEENRQARHQLRSAAIDQRLKAHQEAFTLWRKLLGVMHSDKVGKTVLECQSWWDENCLYLEPSVREAFVKCYSAAHLHDTLLRSREDVEAIKANWNEILAFSKVVFAAVNLPAFTEVEDKSLPKPDPFKA